MRRPWIGALVVACSSEALIARDPGVVAEVHLHQYDFGSHAAAGFISSRVPYREELDEMLVNFAVPPALIEGPCRLGVPQTCSPTCAGGTHYCSNGQCLPYQQLQFRDEGPVVITGSSHAEKITLSFNARSSAYYADRPFSAPLFAAGDLLTVDTALFRAEITAPARPNLITPLLLPSEGAYKIEWEPGKGTIALRLNVASPSGAAAAIVCIADDQGAITIPASMMARVPPPPRTVQLEVERRARRRIPLLGDDLAVVTVASTVVRDRKD